MSKLIKIKNLVIHQSESLDSKILDWSGIRRYHKSLGFDDIGYHYGIELVNRRYEILVGRLMNVEGAHCRASGMNHKSLGIMLMGNFDDASPSVDLWNNAIDLTVSLCYVLNLSVSSVIGHREAGSSKTCPGLKFDMDKFRTDVYLAQGVSNG